MKTPSEWALALASERCVDEGHPSHVRAKCVYCVEAAEDLDAAYQAGERRGRERALAVVEDRAGHGGYGWTREAIATRIRALPDEEPGGELEAAKARWRARRGIVPAHATEVPAPPTTDDAPDEEPGEDR